MKNSIKNSIKNPIKNKTVGKCKGAVVGGQRLADLCLVFSALMLSAVFCVGWLTTKGAVFSPEENRVLSEPPTVSAASLLNGELFSELGGFCADHVPFRLSLIRLRTACELVLGKGQSNDVLFLSKGRLVHRGEYQSLDLLNENLLRLASLKESVGAVCITVPRSVDLYTPFRSESAAEVYSAVVDSLGSYPAYGLLSGELEQDRLYYKTDHHLDRDGAYALYRYVASELGTVPYGKDDFEWQRATDSFLGSAYSDGGAVSFCADSIDLPRYKGDGEYTVQCLDGCGQQELYSLSALETKDKYSVFLGGNHGVLTVRLEGGNRPHILLVKDSFANAVVPMLLRHFDITVYDPRYTNGKLAAGDYDKILIICGVDTLATTAFRPRIEP